MQREDLKYCKYEDSLECVEAEDHNIWIKSFVELISKQAKFVEYLQGYSKLYFSTHSFISSFCIEEVTCHVLFVIDFQTDDARQLLQVNYKVLALNMRSLQLS
jgi:hypothetical protein